MRTEGSGGDRNGISLPRALAPGDVIAMIAPASKVDREALEVGAEALRARGLKVIMGAHVLDTYGHLAGKDQDRASDLMNAFLDSDIKGVFCARGGSGSARILPYLDMASIASHPKVFVGYSDITVLHIAFAHYAGWPTFYGPMATTETECCTDDDCFGSLWRLISDARPAGDLLIPKDTTPLQTLASGIAEGELLGGTLCVLESCIGTPYFPDFKGKIIALEDASEPPWRVDRMLTHLEQAGVFEDVAGFLIGKLSDDENGSLFAEDLPVTQSLMDHLHGRKKPVLYGYPFGHLNQPVTLPMNCRIRLDADRRILTVLDSAVTSSITFPTSDQSVPITKCFSDTNKINIRTCHQMTR